LWRDGHEDGLALLLCHDDEDQRHQQQKQNKGSNYNTSNPALRKSAALGDGNFSISASGRPAAFSLALSFSAVTLEAMLLAAVEDQALALWGRRVPHQSSPVEGEGGGESGGRNITRNGNFRTTGKPGSDSGLESEGGRRGGKGKAGENSGEESVRRRKSLGSQASTSPVEP
jgi:hypothetical protein